MSAAGIAALGAGAAAAWTINGYLLGRSQQAREGGGTAAVATT
jgi:hypothetical protein